MYVAGIERQLDRLGDRVAVTIVLDTPRRGLAARCERALAIGPSSPLLARCATIQQVAGHPDRASYFANALCRLYPGEEPTLIQSMTFVGGKSPAAEDVRSDCVRRAN